MKPAAWLCVPLLAVAALPARAQCPSFTPPGATGNVFALAVFQGQLYAAGDFTAIGAVPAHGIARWNGIAWTTVGGGLGGGAHAVATSLQVFDDGSGGGPALYVAGSFERAGSVLAKNIARWSGTTWTSLGQGTDGMVWALETYDEDAGGPIRPMLYAGGAFHHAGTAAAESIARWNGMVHAWAPLGAGADATVASLEVFDGALYAGGFFSMAGGLPASHIARWNGSSWAPAAGGTNGPVRSLVAFDDLGGPRLYAGGEFQIAGGSPANGVASWTGATWAPLANGIGGISNARADTLFAFDGDNDTIDELWVGGRFTTAGTVSMVPAESYGTESDSLLARWNGSAWVATGHLGGPVRAMTAFQGHVIAAGMFATADSGGAARIAKYDGSSGFWVPISGGNGLSGVVRALETYNDGGGNALVAAGDFAAAGTSVANGIAKWNGAGWTPLGQGLGGSAHALTAAGIALYAGGDFASAGGSPARNIARWNGASWSPLGQGVNATVRALIAWNGGIFAGGDFQSAGGGAASYVARWSGSLWTPLGNGTDGPVRAFAIHDDGSGQALYAGGDFSRAGRADSGHVARWTPALGWRRVGRGLDGNVLALATFDAGDGVKLYAAGEFQRAGGMDAPYLARWDGVQWTAVPGSPGGAIHALAVMPGGTSSGLWAAGSFANVGPTAAGNIARWNGVAWTPVGSGITPGADHAVYALEPFGPMVFAGGGFTALNSNQAASFLAALGCP